MIRRSVKFSAILPVVAILSGCSLSSINHTPVTPNQTIATPHPILLTLPILKEGTWSAVGSTVHGVPVTYVARIDSGKISLLWLNPKLLHFRFIPGTQVPEHSPVRPIDNARATWVPKMAAAFNGGFWLKDLHPGGYFYNGKVVKQLVVGQAALAVTSSGQLHVGMWGRDLKLSKDVIAVRENMPLIIDNYKNITALLSSKLKRLLHASAVRNRSALSQFADGSLIYEYGRGVTIEQMALGLLSIHAPTAMMLDMNGDWPGAFVYFHQGSRVVGVRIHPNIYHNSSMYFTRYKKDFIVALLK